MPFIIGFAVLIMIYIILIPDIKKKKYIENLEKNLKEINNEFKVTILKKDLYDILLEYKDMKYFIKVDSIPKYADVQVNNKSTYQVFYGGSGNHSSKTNNRYLNELIYFINMEVDSNVHKVIIFTPTPREINQYINENEMITVKSNTLVYGITLLKDTDLSYFKNLKEEENESRN